VDVVPARPEGRGNIVKVLFWFLDGVGLGADDQETNPLARADMPRLRALLEGRRLLQKDAPFHGARASLLALDAGLGVEGLPQSATGQAVLLTGRNVPQEIGYHYGPKPNALVAAAVKNGNLFSRTQAEGKQAAFLNAYPPGYFQAIGSGKRMHAAIAMAAEAAGLRLHTLDDLRDGRAVSADLTGAGLAERLGVNDIPILTAEEAGRRLAGLAQSHDFSLFEYWLSDYAGHGQDMTAALELLHTLDGAIGGLAEAWDDGEGLVVMTSDHGNLEDLGTRRHTGNRVPCLLIGAQKARAQFCEGLQDLTGVAPRILTAVGAVNGRNGFNGG
jgi:bisphosphoglycerate-independent phosphoglycerate mutase (AlkP superfamily)